jgi:hypothetical protein
VLDGLSPNATLFNANGTTSSALPSGSPFVNVNVGSDGTLTTNESVPVLLQFTNPSRTAISYTIRVLAGAGDR